MSPLVALAAKVAFTLVVINPGGLVMRTEHLSEKLCYGLGNVMIAQDLDEMTTATCFCEASRRRGR